jgi:hypothetical protein
MGRKKSGGERWGGKGKGKCTGKKSIACRDTNPFPGRLDTIQYYSICVNRKEPWNGYQRSDIGYPETRGLAGLKPGAYIARETLGKVARGAPVEGWREKGG